MFWNSFLHQKLFEYYQFSQKPQNRCTLLCVCGTAGELRALGMGEEGGAGELETHGQADQEDLWAPQRVRRQIRQGHVRSTLDKATQLFLKAENIARKKLSQ